MTAGFMMILIWEKQTVAKKKSCLTQPLDFAGRNIHTALQ